MRVWFWVLLPFVLGLWVSTIYLRHHYVVDLLAGWLLAPVAVAARAAPRRLVGARRQRALGYAPVAGEPLNGGAARRPPSPVAAALLRRGLTLDRPALVAPRERQRGAVAGGRERRS